MKNSIRLIFLLLIVIVFTGCAVPERKGAIIEGGNVFFDDIPPSLRIEFPFMVSLSKEERGYLDGTEGLTSTYRSYELQTYDNNQIAYIHRQALPTSDGKMSHFTRTDDANIKDKLFFKKLIRGYCAVNIEKHNDDIFVKSTVSRYTGQKNVDVVNIYKMLGNAYSLDYVLGYPTDESRPVIEEAIDITNGICSQLEENGLKEDVPNSRTLSPQASSPGKHYLHIINPMVDAVTLQVTFEKQRACEVFSATLKNELDGHLKDSYLCSSETASEGLNYIALLQYKGFDSQLTIETFYSSECEQFLKTVQKDVFDVIQDCETKQGFASAQFNLGVKYDEGQGVPQDYNEAVKWYRLAAEQGYGKAQNNLGVMYSKGLSVPQDYKEAVKWYRQAAEQGLANAQNNLGMMYENGNGVPQDYNEAVKWYRLAAEQGYGKAQNNLGMMYIYGKGVPQDNKEAFKWIRPAAEQGLANAQNNLGMMYNFDLGVQGGDKEAVKWYRQAAEQGLAKAQNTLGMMYIYGTGVPQDYEEAVKWYRQAAEQGYAIAQRNLGVMYEHGNGVPQDYKEAIKWYRPAAEQRDAVAQNNLRMMYENGNGVPQDYKEVEK